MDPGVEFMEPVIASNPFDTALAREHRNYCRFDGRRLVVETSAQPPSHITSFVHDGFRALVLNDHFTCVGAKAAVRQGAYRFGLYGTLATEQSSAGLAHDLFTFSRDCLLSASEFTTFVASFLAPVPPDEAVFEALLWTTLQQLHDLDATHHGWAPEVSDNTSDPQFSFSFAERAFFVVGLHAASSRATRRFAWPTLVFNPREQFDRLKETARYRRFQQVIRGGEESLQGDINPMLADFGDRSEASQYSGRRVGNDWQCPFHAKARGVE
jgi:uncharacterized protein